MVHHMEDFGLEAQAAAEAHLDACFYALDEETKSPASAPFCGCDTCCIRETLHAVWPIMLKAAKKEVSDERVSAENPADR